ncbi:dGTPase [Pseudomonas syringae]|nr:dGTPase [Pseudomonas syringae]
MNKIQVAKRYKELLKEERRRESKGSKDRNLAAQAASDRGRVLFSAAFRRLQSKTQAFPQEWNASVRTRLTHSLEVASIGRYLAEDISDELFKREYFGSRNDIDSFHMANAFISFVEVSCLMHDLGNPPFGHFGEASIQDWFKKRQTKYELVFTKGCSEEFQLLYQDFIYFDGNPQGFRMATKLQWVLDEYGYNLTYTQLAATLKYPWTPDQIGQKVDKKIIKKAGVFHSEKDILDDLQETLNLEPFKRHPLAYIMEAADDISYCLSDIEDALEKNVIRNFDIIFTLRAELEKLAHNNYVLEIIASLPSVDAQDSSWFVGFRTAVTNILVARSCKLYLRRHDEISDGKYFSLLRRSKAAKALLDIVREFSKKYLYSSSVIRERELVGFQVVTGILDRFGSLLDLSSEDAEKLLISRIGLSSDTAVLAPTLESFLPRKHIKAYEHEVNVLRDKKLALPDFELREWMARAHLIVDFLSGMTDDFAIVTYRRLYGAGLANI